MLTLAADISILIEEEIGELNENLNEIISLISLMWPEEIQRYTQVLFKNIMVI